MRTKALLLTLGILGSSTVALADHETGYQGRFSTVYRDRIDDRFDGRRFDGRFDGWYGDRRDDRFADRFDGRRDGGYYDSRFDDRAPYRPRTTWLALTDVQRLDRGGDVFDLRSRERFSQLRLQNQTGRTLVRQIDIVFTDGSHQCVHVDRLLDGNHAMVNVDLDGDARRIAKIVVDGRSARDGSYQLYAM